MAMRMSNGRVRRIDSSSGRHNEGVDGAILRATLASLLVLVWGATPCAAQPNANAVDPHSTAEAESADAAPQAQVPETRLLSGTRQFTFEGRRAGEGYFSADGQKMVFQSERDPSNPFFQIHLMDLSTGDTELVSPGHGKTTCAWIHPDGAKVLYASTQDDPDAKQEQVDELAKRASGEERRYSWDYDEFYDLYEFDLATRKYENLTNTKGYDAEASYSPNGKLIAFASNRQAYEAGFPETQRKRLAEDPAYFMDLYIMNADGSPMPDGQPARRLTDVPGYDGGPFFSPTGTHLCWRRFSEDGARAEIMTMKLDGTEVTQLTRMGAMSWAPYYHPSGEYLIFATNVHGFANFELYLVDVDGQHEPVRVTSTDGFDGLPVFTPDGENLVWTSNRGTQKQSQLYKAEWNHERALELLELDTGPASRSVALAASKALEAGRSTRGDFSPQDILRHVDYLCRPELAGRRTGTQGEKLATAYVAAYLDQLGLSAAGDDQTWFQEFEYTSGVSLGQSNRLAVGEKNYRVGEDWQPVSFSNTGEFDSAELVFAGYGIAAPKDEAQDEYDSFVHLDVEGKWIVAFRFMPEGVSPERRQHLARHSSLRFKAMLARDKGAAGLILVSGPNSAVKRQLISMKFDGSLSSSSLPIISVSDAVVDEWLGREGKSLKQLQDKLDTGEPMMGIALPSVKLSAKIDIEQQTRRGRNVLGRLMSGREPSEQVVIVGAHIDHLGEGSHSSSLARDDDRSTVHWGADDNASGVAAMLEIAQWMSSMKAAGKLPLKRDILFAAWSGEEDGLIGSTHFAKQWDGSGHAHAAGHAHTATSRGDNAASPNGAAHSGSGHGAAAAATKHGAGKSHSEQAATQTNVLYPSIAACLNLDMVGRLDKKLILQGIGSSPLWRGEVERRNAPVGLPITLQNDGYIPTDASVFFTRGVPILSAFTGSHEDYHTPRDTPDKLNYDGATRIAKFMGLVARSVGSAETAPEFTTQQGPKPEQTRARMRAYLGTVPDYAESDVKGVKLSAVSKAGPAAKSGVKGGDVIVELAGRKIENIYDYTYAIEALKIGQPTTIVVKRGAESLRLKIIPESRQ